jgi:uncharacterized protein YpmB
MKYSIIGIIFLVLLLGGLYVYTEGMSETSSSPTAAPVTDNGQYNIKID